MNINGTSVDGLEKDYVTPRCNRARLDTGTFCNYDCEFCYYQGLLHVKTEYETIRERIDKLTEYGITQVDMSGGESSVHKDWFKILDYCNDRFEHISTLSNGWAFAKEDFLIKSKDHGLKEIMFSVHGYDQQCHDSIVRRKRAWDKINRAIELAHKHDIIVRVNCTIYQRNIPGFAAYHDVLKRLNPIEVNFLTLNYWTNNQHAEPLDYKKATDAIKSCIDEIEDHIKYINVRYTPFCYMQGYEKHVCNQFQHIYDIYDWNKEIYHYDLDTSVTYTDAEKIKLAFAEASRCRIDDYHKPHNCVNCKYVKICDGFEKQIESPVAIPVRGAAITDVNQFRRNFYT